MVWAYLQTLGALLLVLALMAGLTYALRKWVLGTRLQKRGMVQIDVLGSTMLQPKVYVYVLRIENKTIAVGVTDHGMHMLTELEYQQLPISLDNDEDRQSGNTAPTFLQYLKHNLGFVHAPSSGKTTEQK